MDNILVLNANKKNTFEFDVEIEGIDSSKTADVRLILNIEDVMYGFKATKEKDKGTKYIVEVPELPHLPKTTFNFTVEVITDGYLFEGAKGIINVLGDPMAHVTAPTVQIKEEPKEEKDKKTAKREEINKKIKESSIPTRPREKSIQQLADEVMAASTNELSKKQINVVQLPIKEDIVEIPSENKDNIVKNLINKIKNTSNDKLVETKPSTTVKDNKHESAIVMESIKEQPKVQESVIDAETEKRAKQFLENTKPETKDDSKKNFKKGKIVER